MDDPVAEACLAKSVFPPSANFAPTGTLWAPLLDITWTYKLGEEKSLTHNQIYILRFFRRYQKRCWRGKVKKSSLVNFLATFLFLLGNKKVFVVTLLCCFFVVCLHCCTQISFLSTGWMGEWRVELPLHSLIDDTWHLVVLKGFRGAKKELFCL